MINYVLGVLNGARLPCVCTEQLVAVVGNKHSENENTNDVEASYPPKSLFDGPGNILVRVRGLAECHPDHLGAGVGKASLTNACPPPQQIARGSFEEVRGKGARIMPIGEAAGLVVRCATCCYDNTGEDKGRHDRNLDDTSPEFYFS